MFWPPRHTPPPKFQTSPPPPPPGLWQAILSKEIRPWIAEINQPLKIHLVSPNKWIYNVYYF